jgi:hypothetical protein
MPYADPEMQRKAQREWIARRRAQFFADKQCAWCQSTSALELHHRDPNKKEAHAIWSWSPARREAEAAKCVVLCAACHVRAHSEARRVEAELRNPCGTLAAYKRGCRCTPCRTANAEHQRDQKKAKAA